MQTPIEKVAALTIGTVESVSPSEIWVLLETDAPQATALNTGAPYGFPRINSYVLIPNETGAVVGMIVWLGIERSAFPKRTGMRDFGMIDLPFPLRKLKLTPLGTLVKMSEKGTFYYALERGVFSFPSVGDSVLLPTREQLKNIIEAGKEADQRVAIGTSPLASDAKITIDPDKMFGRHLAVLGNTGSGKSCSVAGIIRWSLEAAEAERNIKKKTGKVNARFIILDPNGEYFTAFEDMQKNVRRFRVPPVDKGIMELIVPAWMWNSQEWCSFAHAAPGVQRPILLQALRDMRAGGAVAAPIERQIGKFIRICKIMLEGHIARGLSWYGDFPGYMQCGQFLANIAIDAEDHAYRASNELKTGLEKLAAVAKNTAAAKHYKSGVKEGYNAFNGKELGVVLNAITEVLGILPADSVLPLVSEDSPRPFRLNELPEYLEAIASKNPVGQASQFIATLSMRIQMMLADNRLGPVVNPKDGSEVPFGKWLSDHIGDDNAENGQLAILDLSLVQTDVLHVIVAVIARIIFEGIQRYRRIEQKELPTVLVLEEAHTFIRRAAEHEEGQTTPTEMCRHTFERIAREGRKFGLGLVLASQRPSELSPTALAQCNTFLLHRIVNDKDQELVGSLVPDNLGGLLKELPSLPSRQAILLGWASPVPVLVDITELPKKQRPESADPQFWDVWTGKEARPIDWEKIAKDWTG